MPFRCSTPLSLALGLGIAAGLAACSDGNAPVAPPAPVLTAISISVPAASIELGQLITAVAVGLDQNGAPLTISPVSWTSENPEIAAVQLTSGLIIGIAPGTTKLTAAFEGKTGQRTITVTKSPGIRVNEVQPNADAATGWIEFFNPTSTAVDMSGWLLLDSNFFGPSFAFPAGSVIQPGGYLVIEEAALPFGLDAIDDAYLFSRFGVLVDVTFWPVQPLTTFGRCPNGDGKFFLTAAPSKGAANICPT